MKRLLLAALCCGICVGCATKHGRCYPIFGFGWVVVDKDPDTTVVRTTVLGAGITTLPVSAVAGFSQSSFACVPTNRTVTIELK